MNVKLHSITYGDLMPVIFNVYNINKLCMLYSHSGLAHMERKGTDVSGLLKLQSHSIHFIITKISLCYKISCYKSQEWIVSNLYILILKPVFLSFVSKDSNKHIINAIKLET